MRTDVHISLVFHKPKNHGDRNRTNKPLSLFTRAFRTSFFRSFFVFLLVRSFCTSQYSRAHAQFRHVRGNKLRNDPSHRRFPGWRGNPPNYSPHFTLPPPHSSLYSPLSPPHLWFPQTAVTFYRSPTVIFWSTVGSGDLVALS